MKGGLNAALEIIFLISIVSLPTLEAQERPAVQVPRASGRRPASRPTAEPKKQPPKGDEAKEADAKEGEQKDEDDKDKKEEDEAPDSIKRPTTPPENVDPRELEIRPGADGRIRFNFHGQAWLGILEWLADNSNYSLDWQELPNDFVNLTTSRSYTIPEALDLFNRLLLDRGYTMVVHDRVLSVFRISKIDPSLLPRVEDESELLDRSPHEFVKITFKLPDALKADQAAEDVKPLLSPHAKVQPLLATNRLLIIDAVVNLREVSRLVNSEHAAALSHTVPNEFVVKYARADQVADQVMILLGLDPSSRRTPQELQLEQQRLQLFQQMQQRGKDVTKFLRSDDSPKVFLAVNHRNNSILVNAPVSEMQIVERAIQQLDVPSGFAPEISTNSVSMEKYQLVTISPQSIVSALEDIGDLDPRTRLQTDSDAKVVFAHATTRDHEKIKNMIDSLDGSGRQLEVIWLRRLPANAVAATIQNLMVGKDDEKDDDSRRSYFYYPYSRGGNEKKDTTEFRVDADMEKNRLLLWANEAELQEVRKFLEKLGEIPGRTGNPNTVRFLDPQDIESTRQLLKQLQKTWNGPNELKIDLPDSEPESTPPSPTLDKATFRLPDGDRRPVAHHQVTSLHRPQTDSEETTQDPIGRPSMHAHQAMDQMAFDRIAMDLKLDGTSNSATATTAKATIGDPILITMTPDGRIMLNSNDPEALDLIEDLLASISPPAPDYKVFHLKYALASLVTINLEEYFEEDGNFDTQDNWWRAYYGFSFEQQKETGNGLSEQRKIRFIYDYDTNSILVVNASPKQLAVVESLIEIYDTPPSEDSISARSFQIFELKYSKADAVAKTIKEVYRDLLSSKDKDFDNRNKGEKQGSGQTANYYRIAGSSDNENQKTTKVKASFEGALSVGIDEVSNTVIVSAQEEWMPSISKMIEYLDIHARPETKVAVYQLDGQINPVALRTALEDILGDAWVGKRPPKTRSEPDRNQDRSRNPARNNFRDGDTREDGGTGGEQAETTAQSDNNS